MLQELHLKKLHPDLERGLFKLLILLQVLHRPKSFHGYHPESFYNRRLSPSPDQVADRFPAGHFHNFAPPESFSSRRLPSSSTIGLGNHLPYGHLEIYGGRLNQQHSPSIASENIRKIHNSSNQPKAAPNLRYIREAP